MGRFGTGFPAGRRRRILDGSTPPPPPPPPGVSEISPALAWDGTAGSGFASLPADPTRVTAKPALRLIVPPRQTFTDTLLIGVYAGANNAGSLYTNMGLSFVRVHYEGTSHDIAAPSYQSFADANGNIVSYFGWWAKLKHNGTNGVSQVYFEAVPSDATMQSRVAGPYTFFPAAALHDLELEVAPSQAQITGQRYQTLRAARDYARSQGANHPRITITEGGDLVFGDTVASYVGQGYLTYEASVPVTLTLDAATVATGTRADARFRSKYGRQHFKGANITLDFKHALEIYNESGLGSPPDWFDGINITNPNGRYDLWRGYPRSRKLSTLIRGRPWLTECSFSNVPYNGTSASLMRGCTVSQGWQEIATDCDCALGNVINDFNSGDYIAAVNAMQVSYAGAGATATLSCSGDWNSTSRTFTAKVDGSEVGTFTVNDSDADYLAGTNYTVQNVVDWINALSGWSATLLDNSRFATAISIPGGNAGAFTDIDVMSAAFTFVTEFDIHPDFYQVTHVGKENGVLADNVGGGIVAQSLFMKDGPSSDFLVLNNVFDNTNSTQYLSQLGDDHSHVVIAHNSWTRQDFWLRVNVLGYNPDSYCLVANNTAPLLFWEDAADGEVTIAANHFHAGASDPVGATGSSFGGDEDTLFANIAGGDYAPAGALLTNLKSPVLRYDLAGAQRGASAPAGALA
ncbi:hypothetical protein [Altererythrobacter sp.]|uniref:hypothetical protein n=1 Tax=Altererythrobacter sp. TaxID=1872480 RepID=UPI003D0A8D06